MRYLRPKILWGMRWGLQKNKLSSDRRRGNYLAECYRGQRPWPLFLNSVSSVLGNVHNPHRPAAPDHHSAESFVPRGPLRKNRDTSNDALSIIPEVSEVQICLLNISPVRTTYHLLPWLLSNSSSSPSRTGLRPLSSRLLCTCPRMRRQ